MAKQIVRTNPLTPPGVVGLDAGRKRSQRRHQRNRAKSRVLSVIALAVGVGAVAGGALVGYTIYTENQEREAEQAERRYAEIEAERAGLTVGDIIDDLEEQPRFNGNAPPGYQQTPIIEIIEPSP